MGVRGANPPCIRKSCVTYRQPSVFMVAHSWIQPTTDLVVAVFTAEQSSRICEPTQFKLVLFKGQLWLVTHSFQGEETHHTMKGHTGKNQGWLGGRETGESLGKRLYCDFQGGNGQGKVSRLRVGYLNDFGGSGLSGWSLAVWP